MEKKEIRYTTGGIIIHPFDYDTNNRLLKCTSIYNKVIHKREGFTGIYDEEANAFYTHHHNPGWIQSIFPDYKISIEERNPYVYMEPFNLTGDITLSDLQFNMLKAIENCKKDKIFLHMPCGTGKTLLSVFTAMTYYRTRAIIYCYSSKVLKQWVKTFKEFTNIDPSKIVMLEDSLQLDAIYRNEHKEFEIYLCTQKLVESYCKKHGWDKLNTIYINMGVGLQIIDEAHRRVRSMIKIDANTNVYKRLYLSGDYNQTDDLKRKMFYNAFRDAQVIEPTAEEVQDLKYLNACIVYYTSKPTQDDAKSLYNKRTGFLNKFKLAQYEFENSLSHSEMLFNIIDVIKQKNVDNYKIVIFCLMTDHIDAIADLLKFKYPGKLIIRYHKKGVDEYELAMVDKADIIVATYQSLSTGADVKNIGYVISTDLVDEIELHQGSSRIRPPKGFNKEVWLFQLADYGFEFTGRKIKKLMDYLFKKKVKKINSVNYKDQSKEKRF